MEGLADIRVLDLTTTIAGAYATKLLADAGAEVVSVEPADGSPLRQWSVTGSVPEGETGALFHYLQAGKRSVRSSVADDELADLIAGADLLVEEGTVDVEGLRAAHPQLVVLSVTPWGRTGPWADRPWTHFTVEAASGAVLSRGLPHEEPYQGGGRVVEWTTGSYAAAAALPAVLHARRTGAGAHIDSSMIETMAVAGSTFGDLMNAMLDRPPLATPARSLESPSVERAKDGWVGFNTNSGQMFLNYLMVIDRFDLLDDPRWVSLQYRMANLEEWNEIQNAWLREHTVEEVLERAAEFRVAAAQVNDGETILSNDHLVAREVFVENPAGFLQPRPPYLIDGERRPLPKPAPELGEAEGQLTGRTRPEPQTPADAGRLPFEGLRVLDLTSWWAGPSGTGVLAALGAEVIHVESTSHPDGMRATGFYVHPDTWWEYGHMFVAVNVNKEDLALDLTTERGLELAKELVKSCDLIVENFAPRVTERWGLTWDVVHELNPKAVFVRMPAFGLSGPWRDRVGFAQTMEMMAGMSWVTGPLGGPPRIMRGPCDPIAGMHGAVAMVTALEDARRTGQGHLVEAVMVEAGISCAAEQIIEFTAYGQHLTRTGNRSPEAAPQGLYRCAGTERWLALSVATDDQWQALCKVLDWAPDPALATADARHAAHDAIDERLSAWATGQVVESAVDRLVEAGVPAVVAWDPRRESEHPQLVARQLYEDVPHSVVGTQPVPGLPYRWSGIDTWCRTPAPLLGEHNRVVLRRVLGLTDGELDELEASGVIGDRPTGA
ncbi:MAG: CoA transferase [Acidimicrobiales bacterium]|nr:CoA transferase [Acidimicrobiales bacterium]